MNRSTREVVIIDLRGVIARDESTVIRHNNYGECLNQISDGDVSLTVISRGNSTETRKLLDSSNSKCKFIVEESTRFNLLRFIVLSVKYVRKNSSRVQLLVSGDPWETYWCCRLISIFSRKNLKIQVQLHADIFDPHWIRNSAKNWIRFHLFFLNSKSISSIRLVSSSQRRGLISRFPDLGNRIVVAPVPLSIAPNFLSRQPNSSGESDIGFVGRIHKDRGLGLFLKVIERLNQDGWQGRVLVIGGGPEKDEFRKRLEEIVGAPRVSFVGSKSGEELRDYWNKIDVFLNTAPSESYGRSTREALYYGKAVMCLETGGISNLTAERITGQLVIIDPTKPENWIGQLHKVLDIKTQSNYSARVWEQNEQDMLKVVNSWQLN